MSSPGLPCTRKTVTYCSKASEELVGWPGLEPLQGEEVQGAGLVQPGDGHGAFTAGFICLMGPGVERTELGYPQTCSSVRQETNSTCHNMKKNLIR